MIDVGNNRNISYVLHVLVTNSKSVSGKNNPKTIQIRVGQYALGRGSGQVLVKSGLVPGCTHGVVIQKCVGTTWKSSLPLGM